VELCENTGMIKFMIRDRGTGIRKKDLPNIFMMFFTSHAKHADAKQGMGLGLAICETIVEAHGGSIEAHNRKDGPGAEVVFTLPMEDKTDEKAQ
jgi:two-component system sensor histidine kinase KdpD